jgi:hypothetical protein
VLDGDLLPAGLVGSWVDEDALVVRH